MPSSTPHLIPWRVRQAVDRTRAVLSSGCWSGLRALGLAPEQATDRPRRWTIPPLSICDLGGVVFRPLFCPQQYALPAVQKLRRSLQQCAEATGTTLDRSKRWELPVLLAGSGLRGNEVCLDVGCGSSCLPVWLDGVGCEVFAADPETAGVSGTWTLPTARIHVNGNFINYVRRSVADLPFKDEMFDHVFCVSVIEHLPPDILHRGLRELVRVTRPGGTLAISTDVFPDDKGSVVKNHARVFNLTELREHVLLPLQDLHPVYPLDLTLVEGWQRHLQALGAAFNARHSFFAGIWHKPLSAGERRKVNAER